MGLVENFIRGDTGIAVATTARQLGKGRRALVHCINITAQTQELCASSLLGIFMPLEEHPMCEGSGVGQCARVQDGPDMS